MIARTLVLVLVTIVFVVVVSISDGGNPASPPTSFATSGAVWADLDCSGDITIADPLQALLEIGGLPGDTAEFCPFFGTPVEADGVERVFGDVNCDGGANARDAVELLADLAGIGATTGGCPDVGAPVDLTVLAAISEVGEDWRDYGDAPEGGPTLYTGGAATGSFPTSAAAGPSHETPFLFRLGEFETVEEAPRPDDSADDGLLWLEMNECDTSSALLAISLDGLSEAERDTPLTVNIFADWNKDGDWDDADGCTDEWALQNFALDVSGEPDFTVLAVDFPGGDQVDEFWMRVMLTDQAYNPATDNLLAGETEDYLISGGQVFQPDDSAQTSGRAQPLGGEGAGKQFLCKAGVVGHGGDSFFGPPFVQFDFEQTTESFKSGFRVRQIMTALPQPTMEDGTEATDVTLGRTAVNLQKLDKNHQVETDEMKDGRVRVRITVQIITILDPSADMPDAPERLEGPFIFDVSISGWQRNGKSFKGSHECAFYVDHTAFLNAFPDTDRDGFRGGPGHVADLGRDDPKFIFVQHGQGAALETDAMITHCLGLTGQALTDCEKEKGSGYEKSSLTVFGNDGAAVAPADYETVAGIKELRVAKNGRVIRFRTVNDKDRDPLVQRTVIRVEGMRPDDKGTFVDYFRVVIVHERSSKARKLIREFMKDSFVLFEEDEATTIAYQADFQTLLDQAAPFGDAIFDDVTTICDTGGTQAIAHPFHGSLGFILDAPDGQSSDIYYVPASNPASRNVSGLPPPPPCPPGSAVKVGPGPGKFVLDATGCRDRVLWSQINVESDTFSLAAATLEGVLLGPIPGGENVRDPSCFQRCSPDDDQTDDCQEDLVGSTPGDDPSTSVGAYIPLVECPMTCTESVPTPKVILPADGPDVHIRGLAVSPDATKIAWYREASGESQVWVGDFDPFTQTVSNHQQLTSEGFNFDPTWSPDGRQMAFVSDRDGNLEIYVMYADGSGQMNITNTPGANEDEPTWQVP